MSYFERLTKGEHVSSTNKSQTFTIPQDNGTRGRKEEGAKCSIEQKYNQEYGERNKIKKEARKLKTGSQN